MLRRNAAFLITTSVLCLFAGCDPNKPPAPDPLNPGPGPVTTTASGFGLCIGLNQVDPAKWGGWSGKLKGCINDANAMKSLLSARGFQTEQLIDSQATGAAVLAAVERIGTACKPGDIFVVSYSGHGGQLDDENGDEPSGEGLDETWCLWDGHLIDDFLNAALAKIPAGVRVVVLSDSCHSGTVIRMVRSDLRTRGAPEKVTREMSILKEMHVKRATRRPADPLLPIAADDTETPLTRGLPMAVAFRVMNERGDEYEALGRNAPPKAQQTPKAAILLISGCQDSETSADGRVNGLFTECLLKIWNNGGFTGGYQAFQQAVSTMTNDRRVAIDDETQKPNLFTDGPVDDNFKTVQQPFTIRP